MTSVQIIKETPVTMADMREELNKIKKRDKELGFRAAKTEDYINQMILSPKAKELYDALAGLNISRLKEAHIVKIVDLLPQSSKELKSILQSYTITLSNDNIDKIIEIIKKFS